MRRHEVAGSSAISQTLVGQPGGVHLDYYEGDHGDYDALSIKGSHQCEYLITRVMICLTNSSMKISKAQTLT